MKCSVVGCNRVVLARELCGLHYKRLPEVKARKKEYQKEYLQRPEVKAKQREYQKEYYQRPEVKARKRIRSQDFVNIFLKEYKRNWTWRKESPEKITELFADTVCDLTEKQRCDLQEKCLIALNQKKGE